MELAELVRPDFDGFLHARARFVGVLAAELAEGKQPSLHAIAAAAAGGPALTAG
jgi:hypothetical protein